MVRYGAAFLAASDKFASLASMRGIVCAQDRIEHGKAVGVYRGGVSQGGVSPLCTVQNKNSDRMAN